MTDYTVHPDSFSSIELRADEDIDSYISKARGFSSVAEFREFRDANPQRRKEMRKDRDRDNTRVDSDDCDRRRTLELLKAT
jgi:hypothetical protein